MAVDQHVARLRYHPLEKLIVPRPVHRIRYVQEQCVGRRVLDLGAYDETEVAKPQHTSWQWLHGEIARVASETLGVDASAVLGETGRLETNFGTTILHGTVENLDEIVLAFQPEIIIVGELIEHTADTLGWLTRLSRVAPGVRFLATTPNATSIINLALAFARRENCHEDHRQIYSFKTLATLSRQLGMSDVQIHPYYYQSHIFLGRTPRLLLPLVLAADLLLLRPLQFLFPLTAFGLVLEGFLAATRACRRCVRALQ